MNAGLRLQVVAGRGLAPDTAAAILALCEEAYEEPFAQILAEFADPVHLLGYEDAALVSHLLWVPRRLRHGTRELHTAYVEAVATAPARQGRGYARTLLRALPPLLADFDLAALSPSDAAFYAPLGWESWRGPLALAAEGGDVPTPDEEVMILRLPRTPALDLDGPLAAPWRPGDLW